MSRRTKRPSRRPQHILKPVDPGQRRAGIVMDRERAVDSLGTLSADVAGPCRPRRSFGTVLARSWRVVCLSPFSWGGRPPLSLIRTSSASIRASRVPPSNSSSAPVLERGTKPSSSMMRSFNPASLFWNRSSCLDAEPHAGESFMAGHTGERLSKASHTRRALSAGGSASHVALTSAPSRNGSSNSGGRARNSNPIES